MHIFFFIQILSKKPDDTNKKDTNKKDTNKKDIFKGFKTLVFIHSDSRFDIFRADQKLIQQTLVMSQPINPTQQILPLKKTRTGHQGRGTRQSLHGCQRPDLVRVVQRRGVYLVVSEVQ
jgi:hypothetical protein